MSAMHQVQRLKGLGPVPIVHAGQQPSDQVLQFYFARILSVSTRYIAICATNGPLTMPTVTVELLQGSGKSFLA